jgi:hypothetical protein
MFLFSFFSAQQIERCSLEQINQTVARLRLTIAIFPGLFVINPTDR